jgi:tetratricopeptide (TPR) repeat protein
VFEVLGVLPSASDEEIRIAYEGKLKSFQKRGAESAKVLEVREAYGKIASLQGRRDYLIRQYEESGELVEGARDIFSPEELQEIGKKYLDRKQFDRAEKIFEDSIRLFKEDGLSYSYYGFTIFRKAHGLEGKERDLMKDRALKALMKGVQLAPQEAKAHFLLGRVFSIEKDFERAQIALEKTLSIDPKFRAASTELRVINMRLEKQKSTSFIKWKR